MLTILLAIIGVALLPGGAGCGRPVRLTRAPAGRDAGLWVAWPPGAHCVAVPLSDPTEAQMTCEDCMNYRTQPKLAPRTIIGFVVVALILGGCATAGVQTVCTAASLDPRFDITRKECVEGFKAQAERDAHPPTPEAVSCPGTSVWNGVGCTAAKN